MKTNYIIIKGLCSRGGNPLWTYLMRDRKDSSRRRDKKTPVVTVGHRAAVYGDRTAICGNAECKMRKNARCYGYEGCPGFKGK